MWDFLQSAVGQAILMTIVLAVLIAVGCYLVARFRKFAEDDKPTASELLTKFQELRDRGDITETEYRKLRSVLSDQLQQELSQAGSSPLERKEGHSALEAGDNGETV